MVYSLVASLRLHLLAQVLTRAQTPYQCFPNPSLCKQCRTLPRMIQVLVAATPFSHSFALIFVTSGPLLHIPRIARPSQTKHSQAKQVSHLLPMQFGHSRCALFTAPHAEHLFSAMTSCRPLPAINRWRFFLCDVFFLGTARSSPSQRPPSIEGTRPIRTARGMTTAVLRVDCMRLRRGVWVDLLRDKDRATQDV